MEFTIFDLFQFLGGLAFFLFGMNVMSNGLEKVSGSRLERTLEKLTTNKLQGATLGFGVTAVIQSSSATTVMLVGFVNAGIMTLQQAANVIMGANVGTTVTGWLTGLAGLESGGNMVLEFCKPANFSPLLALFGAALLMFCKGKKKDIGNILLGFAVLMYGMTQMSSSMSKLGDIPEFRNMLLAFNNPFLGVVVGAAFTAIIQSSSASVGILQALAASNGLTYHMAIPIIMGQNIGTCVTALISCLGASKNAKRTAMVHLYFNLIGSGLFLALYYGISAVVPSLFAFADGELTPFGISIIHTVFNVLTTILLLPLSDFLCKLAKMTVKDKDDTEKRATALDERLLATPAVAVQQCRNVVNTMSAIAEETLLLAVSSLQGVNEKLSTQVREKEDILDRYEDELGNYLLQLSACEMAEEESREISKMLHFIGDYERIGDHALNILGAAEEMNEKQIRFSPIAEKEISVMTDAIVEIMHMTRKACEIDDIALAERIEPLEQVIDHLRDQIKTNHIIRLRDGNCTIELGFILNDLLTNYERISDHCSNLAACMIELQHRELLTHSYLNRVKRAGHEEFMEEYQLFAGKYALPAAEEAAVQ